MIKPIVDLEKLTDSKSFLSNKYITLKHLFYAYKYKKQPTKICVMTRKDEYSDHPYAVTYEEFCLIIKTYFKFFMLELLKGPVFYFPWKCGFCKPLRKRLKTSRLHPDLLHLIWNDPDNLNATTHMSYISILSCFQHGRLVKIEFSDRFMHKYYVEKVKENPSLLTNLDRTMS